MRGKVRWQAPGAAPAAIRQAKSLLHSAPLSLIVTRRRTMSSFVITFFSAPGATAGLSGSASLTAGQAGSGTRPWRPAAAGMTRISAYFGH
jgi:hypothetical protein